MIVRESLLVFDVLRRLVHLERGSVIAVSCRCSSRDVRSGPGAPVGFESRRSHQDEAETATALWHRTVREVALRHLSGEFLRRSR